MPLLESGEMYLETIYILSKTKKTFRSIDIVDNDGFITLTQEGSEVATKIYERHTLITDFLSSLGVDKEIASADACKIEHYLSEETIKAIKEHTKKNKD